MDTSLSDKRIRISPSISNFREKLLARTGLKEYRIYDIFRSCIFFGLYRPSDYFWFVLHRGKRKVFYCGSDILRLPKWIKYFKATHYCENEVEQKALRKLGIEAKVCPMIFDDVKVPVSFKPSKKPHVYLTTHPGRDKEYGVDKVEQFAHLFPQITFHIYGSLGIGESSGGIKGNIIWHGFTLENEFNEEIKNYQAALRLNQFDGFSEITAKSALMGQYPISWISYPHITGASNAKALRLALNALSKKKEPNYEARKYWLKKLNESLWTILTE